MDWELQVSVIEKLMNRLKSGGKYLMLEGSLDGVEELNAFRKLFNLPKISVQWHNKFFRNKDISNLINRNNYNLEGEYGLGEYFLLTRGIRPVFGGDIDWDSPFNKISSMECISSALDLNTKFSRLKLWIISK